MSTVKSKKLQVGTDATSSNNFTIYQPATPDGTLRIGVGNADSPTEVARFDSIPSYSARAWVNFNGTGTLSIRESGNVSSITDNGVGDYTVNFATAMPDANYTSVANSGLNSVPNAYVVCYTNARATSPFTQAPTTTAMRFVIAKGVLSTDVTSDAEYINVVIIR
jgi:hypothetical protein